MTDTNKLKELLLELPEIKFAELIKSVESSVTTGWSQEIWSDSMISRDILQNTYDGCIESEIDVGKIKISTDNDQVRIWAPNEYNLEKLFYIGSVKSESKQILVGAHGEGVKKCFSDLARKGIFNHIIISSDTSLIFSVGKEVK